MDAVAMLSRTKTPECLRMIYICSLDCRVKALQIEQNQL